MKSREWGDHFRATSGPLEKYRMPVPEGYDRKTKWRLRGSTDAVSPPDNPSPEDPSPEDPEEPVTGTATSPMIRLAHPAMWYLDWCSIVST